jgi:hypothetical protein
MRSATTSDLTFNSALFADFGIGTADPPGGQKPIVPFLVTARSMTTMHNVANFRVQADTNHVSITAYALAYHYKELDQLIENTDNNKDMEARMVEHLAILPVWKYCRNRPEHLRQAVVWNEHSSRVSFIPLLDIASLNITFHTHPKAESSALAQQVYTSYS